MFKGYLSLGGTEIANAARVEAYIRNNAPGIPLRNCIECETLARALEDGVYDSPLVDNAPWIDPNNESTNRFFGVYPLDIQGIEDSTRSATITESIVDGGSVGSVRLATRSIRVRALLLAADEAAMASGMTWLRNALNPALCASHGGSCGGAQLCYYSACPVVTDCWEPTYQAGFGVPIYGETVATSPVLFRETVIQRSIWRASLWPDDDVKEGLILRWGAVSALDDSEWIEQGGPAIMRRINYVPIPDIWYTGPENWDPVFDFYDFDNNGGMGLGQYGDVRTLSYYGGAPGRLKSYSWAGAANNSISIATLVSDGTVAYRNRYPDPNYALPGAWYVIRRNANIEPRPGANWIATGTGALTDELTGGPVFDGNSPLDWIKLTYAGLPTNAVATISTSAAGTASNAVTPNTFFTLSASVRASAPMAAQLRAEWYNGATLISTDTHPFAYSVAGQWQREAVTLTSPATATHVRTTVVFPDLINALPVGGYVGATAFLLEATDEVRAYFDWHMTGPDTDSELIYVEAGDHSSLISARTMTHMANVAGNDAVGAFSSYEGAVVVVPLRNGSNDTYVTYGPETGMQLGMVAGGSYSVLAEGFQYAPQTGGQHEDARSIVVIANGVVIASSAPNPNDDEYHEVKVDFTLPPGTTSASIRFYNGSTDQLYYWLTTSLIEVGPSGTIYYDGPAFTGDDNDSISWNRTGDMAMTNDQSIISFDAMSEETAFGSDLTVRLRASDDDTIIAEALFQLPPRTPYVFGEPQPFVRYSFNAPYTDGMAYLEFGRGGGVELTNIMIERGFTPLPYFDGSTPIDQAMAGYRDLDLLPEQEYEISWTGIPHRSTSVVNRIVLPTFGGSPIPEVWDITTDGVCNGIPRVDIAQGILKGTLSVGLRLPIPDQQQIEHLERTLHDVTAVEGPTIISERVVGGGVMREVDFLMVAGRPSPYGPTRQIMDQRMSDLETTRWVDTDCTEPEAVTIIDPDCPPVPAPPRPPDIPNSCVTEETVWQRYWLPIEREWISSWASTAPQVTITTGEEEIRQVRVRVFPNPFDRAIALGDDDEAAFRRNTAIDGTATTGTIGSGWNVLGSATGTRLTNPFILGDGAYIPAFYRATATSAQAANILGVVYGSLTASPVTPGVPFRFGAYVRSNLGGRNGGFRLTYRDAGGAIVGSAVTQINGLNVADEWYWYSVPTDRIPPAGAAWVQIAFIGANATSVPIGTTMDMTGVIIVKGNERSANFYFDGNANAHGFYNSWEGAVGSSITYSQSSPIDPCAFCSEFVVSYLPSQTTLTVDSILERAFASVQGAVPQSANHLLYSGDGSPMTWPELSCGNPYYMAIDVPEPLLDDVRVRVTLTNKE